MNHATAPLTTPAKRPASSHVIARSPRRSGSGLDRVARCNLYLTDYGRLAEANEVYAEFFSTHKPAKTGVGVSELWAGALIEIEVTAAL